MSTRFRGIGTSAELRMSLSVEAQAAAQVRKIAGENKENGWSNSGNADPAVIGLGTVGYAESIC
jgi:hypothetical protein